MSSSAQLGSIDWTRSPTRAFLDPWKATGRAVFRAVFGLEAEGLEHRPAHGPCIVAANHPSYLDPLFVGSWLEAPQRVMAWDRVFEIPGVSWWARKCGAFPVSLDDSAGSSAIRAQRLAKDVLDRREVLLLFPEGGRSHPHGVMKPFRAGVGRLAALTGSNIVPTCILGSWNAWPHDRSCFRAAKVRVVFLPPIVLDPAECRARARDRAYHAEITRLVESRVRTVVDSARERGVYRTRAQG